jgi:hypothetical protein
VACLVQVQSLLTEGECAAAVSKGDLGHAEDARVEADCFVDRRHCQDEVV